MKHKFLLTVPLLAAALLSSGCVHITVSVDAPAQMDDFYREDVQFESEDEYTGFLEEFGMQAEPEGEFVEGAAVTVWMYEDIELNSGYRAILSEEQFDKYREDSMKLTVTLAFYDNGADGTFEVYSATHWEYPSSWPLNAHNANAYDYIAITWDGNPDLYAVQRQLTDLHEDGEEGEWARCVSDSYAGFIWFSLDSRSELVSTTAHVTIEKPEQVLNKTAELCVTYLYSYEGNINPQIWRLGEYGTPEVGAESGDYRRLELRLDGMDY